MRIDRLDHLVLTVASIEANAGFYTRVLGMEWLTSVPAAQRWPSGPARSTCTRPGKSSSRKHGARRQEARTSASTSMTTSLMYSRSWQQPESPSNRARWSAPARPGRSSAAICATLTATSSNSANTWRDHHKFPRPEWFFTIPASESIARQQLQPRAPERTQLHATSAHMRCRPPRFQVTP